MHAVPENEINPRAKKGVRIRYRYRIRVRKPGLYNAARRRWHKHRKRYWRILIIALLLLLLFLIFEGIQDETIFKFFHPEEYETG